MFSKQYSVILACLAPVLFQGCAQLDVKRMAYQALRTQDCLVNDPTSVCNQNYALEYQEYEHLRNQFLRENQTAQLKREEEKTAPAFNTDSQ